MVPPHRKDSDPLRKSATAQRVGVAASKPPAKGRFGIRGDVAPMEARLTGELPEGPWQYEPKWDGFRCLAFKRGQDVELHAKSGKSLTRYFPEVVMMLRRLPYDQFVVDGELLIEVDGHLSFGALQMRLHPAASRIEKLSRHTPAHLMLFDILLTPEGDVVTDQPLSARRARLEQFCGETSRPGFSISPFTLDRAVATSWLHDDRLSTDGVVAKRLDGIYEAGERAMIKVKRLRTADCVVGGFRYGSGSRLVGSLLLGLYNDAGNLDHVGFTSGIPNAERPALTRRLEALRAPPGFTGKAPGGPSRWSTERSGEWEPLAPRLVVEVRFDHVTDHRFRHGTKFVRWRPDKAPTQCRFDQIEPHSATAVSKKS
jgi:ATP-dependent DNA ligase